jgi:hypothetical protein
MVHTTLKHMHTMAAAVMTVLQEMEQQQAPTNACMYNWPYAYWTIACCSTGCGFALVTWQERCKAAVFWFNQDLDTAREAF